jgi:phospholipase/lecithinase/hemolysin
MCIFASVSNRFDTIVTFGDSLSDNGNLYKYMLHLLPVSPPYYEGRFSNGPLWIEKLYSSYFPHDYTTGFQDYAVGGAGAVLSYKENLPFTISVELTDYLYWNKYGRHDRTLYVIWIGANNYVNGPTNVDDLTTGVVDAIGSVVERIIDNGGDKFLIINIPDLGKSPQAIEGGTTELLSLLTSEHNKKLAHKIKELKKDHPDSVMVYFDVAKLFDEVISNPKAYGVTNSTEPCYTGSYSGWLVKHDFNNPSKATLSTYLDELQSQKTLSISSQQKQELLDNPQIAESLRVGYTMSKLKEAGLIEGDKPLTCDGYIFWDHLHPTTQVHQFIAKEVKKLLDAARINPDVPSEIYDGEYK